MVGGLVNVNNGNNSHTDNKYAQKFSEFVANAKDRYHKHKEKQRERALTKQNHDALGLSVSYKLLILDVILIAVRMFNKNAAEAMININDTIWGSLADILDSAGGWCARIPIIGKGIDAILSGLSSISESILTLLNFLPTVLYNVWEILFWVFIVITLLRIIPNILGKYAVERQYIASRYEASKKELPERRKENATVTSTVISAEFPETDVQPKLERSTQKFDDMFTGMEVFNDRAREESARISKE